MIFYLGTTEVHWLRLGMGMPLFLSARRFRRLKSLPKADVPWALDSGGFTELSSYGTWTVSPQQYALEASKWQRLVGNMQWASPQDWMCEPIIINGGKVGKQVIPGTHLSVREHQRLTVENYLLLRSLAPDVPWIPVLQGWHFDDYMHCLEIYRLAGVNLACCPLVGVGSVCRRQGTAMAEELIVELHKRGIKLHLFGFKIAGLRNVAPLVSSADSMSWSKRARLEKSSLPGCSHRKCNHCPIYASAWRDKVLRAIGDTSRCVQRGLFTGT